MNAHTPGPWKAGLPTQPESQGVYNSEGRMVAECYNVGDRDANARLIAAAPRMLEALKGCLGYFEDMKNAGVNAAWCMPDEKWLAPICAILRDVEGENHG